ncbi:hypothetical protein BDW02DRAFT_118095 [Decorospora gaudefroyi]|uniref:Uncharacterized protein n=1 Tax=Decorospora gaudefroyi TaxID=184978 RepID=A0A6A5KV96_9PLEO|nr:hypothetical protein BDW02DRAFT_118095 [Decorospora gaudefroyi]
MKLSTVLYVMGMSSLVAATPQEENEPEAPALPSGFPPLPSFVVPTGGFPPRPSVSRVPRPSVSPVPRPSMSRSFVTSVRPTPPPRPTRSAIPRPSFPPRPTRSVGIPARPTPTPDEGDEEDDEE